MFDKIKVLSDSCEKFNIPLVVLCDFEVLSEQYAEFVRVECRRNPYFQRWESISEYILDNESGIDMIFHMDATDTEVLRNPFEHVGEKLMVGFEPKTIGSGWILMNHKSEAVTSFVKNYGDNIILNAGIVGGKASELHGFALNVSWFPDDYTDMAAINEVLYSDYGMVDVEYGPHITTAFKKYEKNNKTALFRHK